MCCAGGSCTCLDGMYDEVVGGTETPVILHIYDVFGHQHVQQVNKVFRTVGTGAFHGAVEVFGQEWSYGYVEEGSGVFSCAPKRCTGHSYRESIPMGTTRLPRKEVLAIIEDMKGKWLGRDYDLLRRNCCHFSDELVQRLGLRGIPPWVNNLAGAGATLDQGMRTAVSAARSAAIIAAAKAGEVDEKYKIRGTVQAGAKEFLVRAGEFDRQYGVSESVKGAMQGVAAHAQATMEIGRQNRGGPPSQGYTFGDLTRGVMLRMGMAPAPERGPSPPPPMGRQPARW